MGDLLDFERFRALTQAIDQIPPSEGSLKHGGGDGTSGGMSDDWKEGVDRRLGQLHNDVRALLNRGVFAVVALAGMIAGLYIRTDEKFEKVNDRIAALERKVDAMDIRMNAKLDQLIEKDAQRK